MAEDIIASALADSFHQQLTREFKVRTDKMRQSKTGRSYRALGYTKSSDAEVKTAPPKLLRKSGSTIINAAAPIAAPQVVLGGVHLCARHPDEWDVNIYKSAILGSGFSGFILPEFEGVMDLIKQDFELRTGINPDDLDQSAQCLLSGDNRLKWAINNDSNIYATQLHAIVETQIALDNVLNSPAFDSVDVTWAGPLQFGHDAVVTITRPGGVSESMTLSFAPDPRILNTGQIAKLEIIIIHHAGSWHLHVTRSS